MILDGVYNDVKDADGLRAPSARRACELGFDGKTLIHPGQVDRPTTCGRRSADEVDYARRVIAAFEEADRRRTGVVTVDGRMIENLHVANARRTLAIAEAIAASADRSMFGYKVQSVRHVLYRITFTP